MNSDLPIQERDLDAVDSYVTITLNCFVCDRKPAPNGSDFKIDHLAHYDLMKFHIWKIRREIL